MMFTGIGDNPSPVEMLNAVCRFAATAKSLNEAAPRAPGATADQVVAWRDAISAAPRDQLVKTVYDIFRTILSLSLIHI